MTRRYVLFYYHFAYEYELIPASLDDTGSANGAHPARLYHDVSEEASGWAHQIDIQSDL